MEIILSPSEIEGALRDYLQRKYWNFIITELKPLVRSGLILPNFDGYQVLLQEKIKYIHRDSAKFSKGRPDCKFCQGSGIRNNDDVDDCNCVEEYQKELRKIYE